MLFCAKPFAWKIGNIRIKWACKLNKPSENIHQMVLISDQINQVKSAIK